MKHYVPGLLQHVLGPLPAAPYLTDFVCDVIFVFSNGFQEDQAVVDFVSVSPQQRPSIVDNTMPQVEILSDIQGATSSWDTPHELVGGLQIHFIKFYTDILKHTRFVILEAC